MLKRKKRFQDSMFFILHKSLIKNNLLNINSDFVVIKCY